MALQQRGISRLRSTDADSVLNVGDEYLAVANTTGRGSLHNDLDHAPGLFIRYDDLNLYLRQELNDIFSAAIELLVSFLAAKSFYFGYRYTQNTHTGQSLFNFFQLEWFDDRFYLLHGSLLSIYRTQITHNRLVVVAALFVFRDIQTRDFVLIAYAQSNELVHELEQNECNHATPDHCDDDTDALGRQLLDDGVFT